MDDISLDEEELEESDNNDTDFAIESDSFTSLWRHNLLTHFFGSSEILKSFKAKPQSKTIQWFNFSYMGKTNRKSETNIIPTFW